MRTRSKLLLTALKRAEVLVGFVTGAIMGAPMHRRRNIFGSWIDCNYTTSAVHPAWLVIHRDTGAGALTEVTAEGRITSENGFPCPTLAYLGSGPFSTPGGTRVTVTLI
jgi:hypothetical protein